MAIGTTINATPVTHELKRVIAGSCHGKWFQAYDDAQTASTANSLYEPGLITQSQFHLIKVDQGFTRAFIQPRITYNAGVTIGTVPIVYLVGAYSSASVANGALPAQVSGGAAGVDSPTTSINGSYRFVRLDTAGGLLTGAGISCTFNTLDTTHSQYDAAWFYGVFQAGSAGTGYDLQGSEWVGVIVATAAGSISGGAATTYVPIDILLLN